MARWSTCRTGLLVATLAALAAAPCLHAEEPQLNVGRFAFADIEALYQMYDNPAEGWNTAEAFAFKQPKGLKSLLD